MKHEEHEGHEEEARKAEDGISFVFVVIEALRTLERLRLQGKAKDRYMKDYEEAAGKSRGQLDTGSSSTISRSG